MTRLRVSSERWLLVVLGGVLLTFLAIPLLVLLASTSAADLRAGLTHPLVWPALRLSLVTSTTSLVLVLLFGTPLAWTLSGSRGRLSRLIETSVQLPIVIPPAVAGIALLLAFGRSGPFGFPLTFTTAAVVVAESFVSAPFFVQAATSAFRRVDRRLIVVARTFGASPLRVFFRVAVPLAGPGLAAGAAMSWARALGEFGATLMFAGNLQGRTQTLPLAIYTALESDLRAARALSFVLVVVALALLAFVRAVLQRSAAQKEQLP